MERASFGRYEQGTRNWCDEIENSLKKLAKLRAETGFATYLRSVDARLD